MTKDMIEGKLDEVSSGSDNLSEQTAESAEKLKEKSKLRNIIEKTAVTAVAALSLHTGVVKAGQDALNKGIEDANMSKIPLEFVQEGVSVDVPANAQKYNSGDMVYTVWQKKDGSLAMKVLESDDKSGNDEAFLSFNYAGADYTYDMQSPVSYALVDTMDRCDTNDDGQINGFKEKICIPKSGNFTREMNIAENEAQMVANAKVRAENEKERSEIAKKRAEIAEERIKAEQSIAESQRLIGEALQSMHDRFNVTPETEQITKSEEEKEKTI